MNEREGLVWWMKIEFNVYAAFSPIHQARRIGCSYLFSVFTTTADSVEVKKKLYSAGFAWIIHNIGKMQAGQHEPSNRDEQMRGKKQQTLLWNKKTTNIEHRRRTREKNINHMRTLDKRFYHLNFSCICLARNNIYCLKPHTDSRIINNTVFGVLCVCFVCRHRISLNQALDSLRFLFIFYEWTHTKQCSKVH